MTARTKTMTLQIDEELREFLTLFTTCVTLHPQRTETSRIE